MRIDYNIIWFENDESWIKPTQKNIADFLEEHGFVLNATVEKDGTNLENLLSSIDNKTKDVDVIFMDYQLAGTENGDKIINRIRQYELFTEIIFYSQKENVKQIIEGKYGSFEGIYYAGRDTFLQKTKEILKHTIKKVEDVESMRGLIIGAVSEIENTMKEIILRYIESCTPEIKNRIAAPIFEEVGKNLKEKNDKHAEYLPKLNLKKLIKDNALFDANKKAYAFQAVINELQNTDIEEFKGDLFYKSISELLLTRNKFGHAKVVLNSKGFRVLESPDPVVVFTDENCISIRKQLIEHLQIIKRVEACLDA